LNMRILVEPGSYHCLNLGDVAMLQVLVARLSHLWPGAAIQVLTDAPDRLLAYCPKVQPVDARGRRVWFQDGCLFSPFHRLLWEPLSSRLTDLEREARRRYPSLVEALLRFKNRISGRDRQDLSEFLKAIREAHLIIVSGQGSINDAFHGHALNLLGVLGMAIRRGTPTALFGQGLGPLSNNRLRARVKEVLPFVTRLALREGRASLPLLESLGIDLSNVVVTGDDAIEPAYVARTREIGNEIGVNLRLAPYSQAGSSLVERVRLPLRQAASTYGASLVPVPIAIDDETSDARAIRLLIDGYERPADAEQYLDTPLKVIKQVGRCRVVVAGSYHAAVFAMAQGISTVCLAKSEYYVDKFMGLADQFGAGCKVIMLDDARLSEKLQSAVEDAWRQAEGVRPLLLDAAVRQIEASRAAYYTFHQQVSSGGLLNPASRKIEGGALRQPRLNGT
jgi:colanic acid/amylovoran biosynthesis protein